MHICTCVVGLGNPTDLHYCMHIMQTRPTICITACKAWLPRYKSLYIAILCTEVFKESTPIAGVPLSCLNVSVYRGLQREHPHCWDTTLLPQCICVQRSSKRAPPLLGYHSLASMYLCTEVFKESTPIAGIPLSCLNVSVYRGL